MTGYRNKEELQKAINEGYFDINTYEKISHKGLLLEKILNMAKNDKDSMFRQLEALVEEVINDDNTNDISEAQVKEETTPNAEVEEVTPRSWVRRLRNRVEINDEQNFKGGLGRGFGRGRGLGSGLGRGRR